MEIDGNICIMYSQWDISFQLLYWEIERERERERLKIIIIIK